MYPSVELVNGASWLRLQGGRSAIVINLEEYLVFVAEPPENLVVERGPCEQSFTMVSVGVKVEALAHTVGREVPLDALIHLWSD